MREAEVDRNPSQFLFGQAVWICAGQRFNQRALTVVYMPCGGDDEMLGTGHHLLFGQRNLKLTLNSLLRLPRASQRSNRADQFCILLRENSTQVNLELLACDIAHHWHSMFPQARGNLLRFKRRVSYI